jgi:predicted nucleic acid-binding protein
MASVLSYERTPSRTNCIFDLVRPKPDRRVIGWMEAVDEALLYLSILTVGEIRTGLAGFCTR